METELGLMMISESRSSVYDVMEADEGYSPVEIGNIYNLSPLQVKVALAYIAEHRAQLEPELQAILIQRAKNEPYHRVLVAEIEKRRPVRMTPQHSTLNKLLQEYYERWGSNRSDNLRQSQITDKRISL